MNKMTQNGWVSMNALTKFRSSARDKNFAYEEATYYVIVKQILELDYHDFKVVVFNCDWERTKDANGHMVDSKTNLVYVNLSRLMKNTKEVDGPIVLVSQATQLFYCKDHSRPMDEWHVVLDVLKRLNPDVDCYKDPVSLYGKKE